MLISSLTLFAVAVLGGLVTTWLAFAQVAIFSSIVEEGERPPGEDYASAALVTRILERPRVVYLQLAAVRTACRWITLGCLMAIALAEGPGSHVVLAALGAVALFSVEEELPLRLVLRNPAAWAMRLLPPLSLALQILNAVSPLFERTYGLAKALVKNRGGKEPPMSVEELTMMAAAGGADLGAEERRILRGIFRSSGILVADIMTHRDRIAALQAGATPREALDGFRSSRHSRLPIFEGTLDHVVGVAHAKDFLRPAFQPEILDGSIRPFLREPYFVRQDRRIYELFDELRLGKVHLAVVVDRMGRTVGIVSLEDMLEEIVGEIHDELEAEKVR